MRSLLRPLCWLLGHAWHVDEVRFIGWENRVEKHCSCSLCGKKEVR